MDTKPTISVSENNDSANDPVAFTKAGFKHVVSLVRAANAFPRGKARDLYTTYASFNGITDQFSDYALALSNEILDIQGVRGRLKRECNSAFNDCYDLVVCNDQLVTGLHTTLDFMAGYRREPEPKIIEAAQATANRANISSWNLRPVMKKNTTSVAEVSTQSIPKPQLAFKDPVDNSEHILWKPKITEKPNCIVPLSLVEEERDGIVIGYKHPYEVELQHYQVPDRFLQAPTDPEVPKSLQDTTYTYIDKLSKLEELVEHLDTVDAVAVDLEHHGYRTYLGITCLMQLTTDSGGDFIIDTLALRDQLYRLNRCFTNPNILKVFHGATSDIIWLQRDLGVYVVGMFDTFFAARTLDMPVKKLQALVAHYANVQLDKRYQTADWRVRPLPLEMLEYARSDTHYLLHIWRQLTRDLLMLEGGAAKLSSVYDESRLLCGEKYNKPRPINDLSHLQLVRRSFFNQKQLVCAKWLFKWRDEIARAEDESLQYVMPEHMLLRLAEIQPREMQGILGCCTPTPPLVRRHLTQLHTIILASREFSAPIPDPATVAMTTNLMEVDTPQPHDSHAWKTQMNLPSWLENKSRNEISNQDAEKNEGSPLIAHRISRKQRPEIPSSPYYRYCMFREITKKDENDQLRKMEAKIFAMNKNLSGPISRIIEKDIAIKLEASDNAIHTTKNMKIKIKQEKY